MNKTKQKAVKIGRVAKYMRVVVFRDRDRVYSRRLKRFTKKFGRWYWVAGDVTSYHLGTGDTAEVAVQRLITQVQHSRLMIDDERAKGTKVILWRCDLEPNERAEWEKKAKETGFVLEHVQIPRYPKAWDRYVGHMKFRPYKPGHSRKAKV